MEADSNTRSSVPITIRFVSILIPTQSFRQPRQLEAIIRISESLAKLSLSPFATEQHVDEAIRLFRVSTLDATRCGYSSNLQPHLLIQNSEWRRGDD